MSEAVWALIVVVGLVVLGGWLVGRGRAARRNRPGYDEASGWMSLGALSFLPWLFAGGGMGREGGDVRGGDAGAGDAGGGDYTPGEYGPGDVGGSGGDFGGGGDAGGGGW